MAMFQRSKALLVAVAALLTVTIAIDADAGNRLFRHHHFVKRIAVKTNVRVNNRIAVTVVDGGRRHRIYRNNTYSGDVAVYYRHGVGSWSYGTVAAPESSLALHPNAKIIDLNGGKTGCSMEKGVCVIRP
jgi:hypothetical protein